MLFISLTSCHLQKGFSLFRICFYSLFLLSIYLCLQKIERKQRKFNPLVIPKALQANLPFESKPKNVPHRKRPLLEDRRAVVMEPHERKLHALVQQLRLIRNDKVCDFRYWPDNILHIFLPLEFQRSQCSGKCRASCIADWHQLKSSQLRTFLIRHL